MDRKEMPKMLEHYTAVYVYNSDETRLFLSDAAGSHARCKELPVPWRQAEQAPHCCSAVCVNMDNSDKKAPLAIGEEFPRIPAALPTLGSAT